MSRPLRIEFPGAVYHVMNRGTSRRKTFLGKADYEQFLRTLSETHELWGVEVFAYCLMDNHYHVCLRTPDGNLSRIMRHVDGLYTQRFNRAHRSDGSLFRGRYKALLIDADEYLTAVVRYIHLNPVEGGCVREPDAYRWSSHRFYISGKDIPEWLRTGEILERFSSDPSAFHQFVRSGNDDGIREFYARSRRSPVLGGERFVERIRQHVRRLTPEHPRYERKEVRPGVDDVLREVARVYQVAVENLVRGGRGQASEARKAAMYLVKRLCDLTLAETAEHFGVGSYGAVGWACHAVRSAIKVDGPFRERVEQVQALINQQKI